MGENKVKQMTAQEAIEVLDSPSTHIHIVHKTENGMEFLTYSAKLVGALEMAIEALEKQASIERALERLEELAETYLGDANCAVYESIEIIKEELHRITSTEQ